jgi:phosphoesterase RecJ-like protein
MRSTDGRVDVSAIARLHGGGGHRRAAGFGTDLEYDQVVEFLVGEIASQLAS